MFDNILISSPRPLPYKFLIGLILTSLLLACEAKPKPIDYGKDNCHFCSMTVVDKSHVAECVTKKGKSFVFDAIECMVMDINRNLNESDLAYVLVADYVHPGHLFDAHKATFLISEAIKSPMGAHLSAFESNEQALSVQREKGGALYTWEELKQKLHR